MRTSPFTSFSESLDRFLDARASGPFATGRWLASLSDDHLYRLTSLIALALEDNNEDAWDDLAATVMMADGAESDHNRLDWTGHEIVDRVTALSVIAALESLRRQGVVHLKQALTIQPESVAAVSTRKIRSTIGDFTH